MERPDCKVLARWAERVRPGVIVSTVTDAVVAQTVVFIADPREVVGFRTVVTYSPPSRDVEGHKRALALVRHPSDPLSIGESMTARALEATASLARLVDAVVDQVSATRDVFDALAGSFPAAHHRRSGVHR